jgi:hypothetical protein
LEHLLALNQSYFGCLVYFEQSTNVSNGSDVNHIVYGASQGSYVVGTVANVAVDNVVCFEYDLFIGKQIVVGEATHR